jgi:hypothetical protein
LQEPTRSSLDDEVLRKKIQKFDELFDDSEDEPITLGSLYKSVLNVILNEKFC